MNPRFHGMRHTLILIAAILAMGCTLLDENPKFKMPGAPISKIPYAEHLGMWRGHLLVQAESNGGRGVAVVDTGADTVMAYYPVPSFYYPQFALAQESLLVHTNAAGDDLHVINLVTGTSASHKPNDPHPLAYSYPFVFMYGSGERLFISFAGTKSAELLEGARFEDLMPTALYGVATQAGRTFVIRSRLSRKLYYANAGGAFDSLDLGSILQDTVAGIQQMVAHGGYLFLQMSDQTYPVYKDTAYIAVLNTTTFTLEKTIALKYSSYNSRPVHPRVAHGKWYLCGSWISDAGSIYGVDVLDLSTRTLEQPLSFAGSPAGIRDFVALAPHSGYVIPMSMRNTHRIKKVTF